MDVPGILIFASRAFFVVSLLATNARAQDIKPIGAGQLGSEGVWSLRIKLTDTEFAAMEPSAPQGLAFGGQTPPIRKADGEPARQTLPNLFGTQFPWVEGILNLTMGQSKEATEGRKCRLRYDGDFTYMMAAAGPKRPLFLELLEGEPIEGSRRFRLHTMQFDPTMLRERIAAHIFATLKVPVSRVIHAEVELTVGEQKPRRIGLYAALEAVDAEFLTRNEIPATSLVMQTNGLNSMQYVGDEWTAYAPLFRAARVPTKQEQDRIIAFAKLIGDANDDEFKSRINEFIDTSALLRYVAGNSLTSNLTGFSSIGVNDYLCLAPSGRFHLVTGEMEVALSGSVLSGTPDQLANLSLTHPYSGECKLVDRLMKDVKMKDEYLKIVQDFINTSFTNESMNEVITSIEKETTDARQLEVTAAAERVRQASAGNGVIPGFGPGMGTAMPASLDVRTFVAKRLDSVIKQLSGNDRGYIPTPPNFGGGGGGGNGGGFGPPRRQADSAPITETQFSESVQVSPDFKATLFARSPEVNYPVTISAEPSGAIYVASDEQGSLGTDKNGGKVLRCVDRDGDGVMDSVTTFCRVDHVRGVFFRGGDVWVCHPPFLSVFHDDNSDGVADRSQQLVSGLTTDLVNTRGGDHTTTTVEYLGESNESESWCSPQQRIAAFRSPQMLHFVNYSEGTQWNFSEKAKAIYHWRADMNFENVGRTIVHALLSDGDLAAAFPIHKVSNVEKSRIDSDGPSRFQYLFDLKLKNNAAVHSHAIVQVDRASGRIVLWDETHAGGMRIVTRFDYPASGPRDIYELGADANAAVIDRVAGSDVVELAEHFQQQVCNFGDYEALVIDQRQADDATPEGAPLFRRLWRSGEKFRVELLTPIEADFNVPTEADLSWWYANRTQFTATPLADCDGEVCTLFVVDDPRLEIASEMSPRIKQQSTLPVLSVNNLAGTTNIPIWTSVWPEYACRPMLMTSDPTLHFDIDPAGTNGPPNTLRLRLLAPESPLTKERASYWLSLDNDHCVIKSRLIRADFEGTVVGPIERHVDYEYSDYLKSPSGITFAARRSASGSDRTWTRITRYVINFDMKK